MYGECKYKETDLGSVCRWASSLLPTLYNRIKSPIHGLLLNFQYKDSLFVTYTTVDRLDSVIPECFMYIFNLEFTGRTLYIGM